MQQLLGKMTMMSTLSLFLAILMFIWTNQWYIFFTFLTAIVCISAISMGQEDGFGDRDSFNYLNLAHLKMMEVCLWNTFVLFVCFTRHLVCLFLLGKPAQREGARTGLEVLCEVLHPTLSRPERPDHNTGNYMPYSLRQVCGFFYVPQDYEH